jgi:hypothetical protein
VISIPVVPSLPNEYLKRARILSRREDILRFLPKDAVFCEIGVAYGDFSAAVIETCAPRKLIAIDRFDLEQHPGIWGLARLGGRPHEEFYRRRFEKELGAGLMEPMRGHINAVLSLLSDGSVDIFYIAACDSYEAVAEELGIIRYKVAPSGWIVLNGYTLNNVASETGHGVIHAAHEFILAEGWEMKFLALHPFMSCNIALQKKKFAPARPAGVHAGGVRRGVRQGLPQPTPAAAVRLIIWEADDIRTERDTIVALASRGIMSSVCTTTNDADETRRMLELAGVWDYLIFASIDRTTKAKRVAAIIAAVELPVASVMLIEDNLTNLAQIAELLPGMQIGHPRLISAILADRRFVGEDDQELTRLARYKSLEGLDMARASGDGTLATPLPVRVCIDPDVAAHLDRAIELINSAQLLNFTKRRLRENLAEARQQLSSEIALHYVRAGLIAVSDERDNYGYCGFYSMMDTELLDYCFSRTILGLGVEAWLFERLGRPSLAIAGEVAADLTRPTQPGRITLTIGNHDAGERQALAISEVRLRGGHDVAALAHYFRLAGSTVGVETDDYRGPLFVQRDSSALVAPALGGAPPGFCDAVAALGYEAADFAGTFLDPAAPGSIIVYSPGGDVYLPVYRHKVQGFAIPVNVDIYEDLTTIADDALGKALAKIAADDQAKITAIVAALRAHYSWESRLPLAEALDIVRGIFERIPRGARFLLILPYEWVKWDGALEPRPEAVEYNAAIREIARHYPAVNLLTMNELVGGAHEMQQGFDVFDRIVYARLYQRIMRVIGASPSSPIDAPASGAKPTDRRATNAL